MTNEETLNLLKQIMLDGTEKAGDKVYCTMHGDSMIEVIENATYQIKTHATSYTHLGFMMVNNQLPTLFKVNPFEWLAKQNNSQERVIEVQDLDGIWLKRVVFAIKNGMAICWDVAENIEDAKKRISTSAWETWRELPTKITKEEALKMLSEKGYDTTNLIIE